MLIGFILYPCFVFTMQFASKYYLSCSLFFFWIALFQGATSGKTGRPVEIQMFLYDTLIVSLRHSHRSSLSLGVFEVMKL